ncbi:NUDIX hydrolase [Pseudohalioglobus lutimaris]|uniref:NUDIX hydrolase n=1 Tax=Pseudohalioglobus lutimaris TaxID=1737061 RepID=A0A2N5WYH5_9GAMM|nr:NUDIX hydrolase [Pseudohalioglobus lutimaris]PLW67294.1 NUDIX hydrolase [Pseudohalioglobus lutimaris]
MSDSSTVRPASTVVLLRDSDAGLETLLLRRNKALAFAGGFWVFPGGSLDEADMAAGEGDEERAARVAAAREAMEECGQRPRPEDMVLLSHWTTPETEKRRFSTWIYAAPLEANEKVVIDGGEIHDHRWLPLEQALAEHYAGELRILPPTMVTLSRLSVYRTVAQLLKAEKDSPVPRVLPVITGYEDTIVSLYHGDAGYETVDPALPGARHRAILEDGRWRYVYENVPDDIAPLVPQEADA